MKKLHFHRELENLNSIILDMAAKTLMAFESSISAYDKRDSTKAEAVIKGDDEINNIELQVDQISLRLLALEQPMARDLRLIIGLMRICNELERIADQAVNIAERTLFLSKYQPSRQVMSLRELMEISGSMLRNSITALQNMDSRLARKVRQMDDRADTKTLQVLKDMIERLADDTTQKNDRKINLQIAIHIIIISRCLERIADLSTNIAEHIAFITDGINLKHQKESPDP